MAIISVTMSAERHERLKAEAEARGFSVSKLADLCIERGLPTLMPVPVPGEPITWAKES